MNLNEINQRISDRADCFYWQTDRKVSAEETAKVALENGIPAYKTYCIHELESENDISYQVIEKLEGNIVQFYLKEHLNQEEQLVFEMGKTMAKLHKIKVHGFGPFDNEQAKNGMLRGIHKSLKDFVNAGLEENLKRLVNDHILSKETTNKIKKLFHDNELLNSKTSVLIHNDFADWNLLTNGNTITGVIDWDECVAGNPVQEIACWSTFFELERIESFLRGYFSEIPMYDNFNEMFQLMRLRYTVSKMALRIKRFTYEQTPFFKDMIKKGEKHLEELLKIFKLNEDISIK